MYPARKPFQNLLDRVNPTMIYPYRVYETRHVLSAYSKAMRRLTALVLVMAMFLGIGSYPILTALACPMGEAMPANCPMREAAKPAPPPVVEVASEAHSCCPKAKKAIHTIAHPKQDSRQITGRCCCDLRSAPDTGDSTFVLPHIELGAWILPAPPVVYTPALRALPVYSMPAWKVDVPRGPPCALHSPRAPPLFS